MIMKGYFMKSSIALMVLSAALASCTQDEIVQNDVPTRQALEYVGTEMAGMKEMRNLTNDRLHTNGTKALYPTFVNIGEKPYLEGDAELMTIKFKAKRKQKIDLNVLDGMLVDKNLNTVKF